MDHHRHAAEEGREEKEQEVIENMRVESVSLGTSDHGVLSAWLHLAGDGWGQGFGGFAMDEYDKNKKRRVGHAFGAEFILRILETLGVDQWEKLPNTPLRVDRNDGGITRIGHFLKDQWFDPKELAQEYDQ